MKLLHPITLWVVLTGCIVSEAVEIPDNYKQICLKEPESLSNYLTAIDNSPCAFFLESSIISSDVHIEGGELIFTSESEKYSIEFSNKGGKVFSHTESLLFESLNNVSFHDAKSWALSVNGGAIYATNDVSILQNRGVVEFSNNCANAGGGNVNYTERIAKGGAIFSSGILSLNGNDKGVLFINNSAIASLASYYAPHEAYGGAIYSSNVLNINNNGNVEFVQNYTNASDARPDAVTLGGAIYSSGVITLVGNESVIFEKNYEVVQMRSSVPIYKNYHLRSIYLDSEISGNNLILSAKTGGHITVYDSVYMSYCLDSTVSLNADYEDEDGVIQKATGDIIFSGRYTEEHLKEIKGGTAGTASEITNSRTSELLNTVNLYGGTLRVEDKAILNTHDINVVADGNATMKVLDATVNAGTYSVNVNSTGQLTLGGIDGSSSLTASNVNIQQGATLSAENTVTDVASVITLASADSISIFNEKLGGTIIGNLNLASGAAYNADGAHLSITSGTLTFNSTATDKINLILTLGAEYNEDSKVLLFTDVSTVKFVLDNITATKTGQSITLNATDYFAGEWINENTQLIYEGGNVYLTGVNRVIPEPTTATLSFFALAGLAMRRRRRK